MWKEKIEYRTIPLNFGVCGVNIGIGGREAGRVAASPQLGRNLFHSDDFITKNNSFPQNVNR